MTSQDKLISRPALNSYSNWINSTLVAGVAIGGISLGVIALKIGPISRQAESWNVCVNRTGAYLATLPGFSSVGADGLEAMSVSLCNGSTPQREVSSSKAN